MIAVVGPVQHFCFLTVHYLHRNKVQYTYILKQKGVDGAWASFTVWTLSSVNYTVLPYPDFDTYTVPKKRYILGFFVVARINRTLVFSAKDNFVFEQPGAYGLYFTTRSVTKFVSCKKVIPLLPAIDIKWALIYAVNFNAKHHMLFDDMALALLILIYSPKQTQKLASKLYLC